MAQSDDDHQDGGVSENGESAPRLKEPHLLDLADFAEVVQWLLMVAVSGVTYDLMKKPAVDLLKTLQKQKGRRHLRQLRDEVIERAAKAGEEMDAETAQRIQRLFEDFT